MLIFIELSIKHVNVFTGISGSLFFVMYSSVTHFYWILCCCKLKSKLTKQTFRAIKAVFYNSRRLNKFANKFNWLTQKLRIPNSMKLC